VLQLAHVGPAICPWWRGRSPFAVGFQVVAGEVHRFEGSAPSLGNPIHFEGLVMAVEKKASAKVDDWVGKAKAGLGKLTGDKGVENEGKLDQAKSSVKYAARKVKDMFK
jgi:uncharacterized protein YjbJ (UPF0337 family)